MKNNTIRILYIITKLELGGAQKVCLSLLKKVNENGIPTGLISGPEGTLISEVQDSKTTFLLDSFKREIGFKFIIYEIKTFFQIILIIKKLKIKYPDLIVHTHSTKAGLLGRWAAFFSGTKTIIHTIHGFGFNNYQSKSKWNTIFWMEYLTSLITTHFICVSQKDRKFGICRFPNFKQKSSIIRAATEWGNFSIPTSTPTKSSSFIIGTISCFKPQKNIFAILNAFKLLHQNSNQKYKQQIKLQIIGDGILRPQIVQWINQNKLTKQIDLLGWQKDVKTVIKNWKIFVLSSLWEGLPISIIEARICNLPVVAYDVGGISEVILNEKNGFLIPPNNFHALYERLKILIESKKLRKKMSRYRDNLNEFGNTVMIDKHINLYKKYISSTIN